MEGFAQPDPARQTDISSVTADDDAAFFAEQRIKAREQHPSSKFRAERILSAVPEELLAVWVDEHNGVTTLSLCEDLEMPGPLHLEGLLGRDSNDSSLTLDLELLSPITSSSLDAYLEAAIKPRTEWALRIRNARGAVGTALAITGAEFLSTLDLPPSSSGEPS